MSPSRSEDEQVAPGEPEAAAPAESLRRLVSRARSGRGATRAAAFQDQEATLALPRELPDDAVTRAVPAQALAREEPAADEPTVAIAPVPGSAARRGRPRGSAARVPADSASDEPSGAGLVVPEVPDSSDAPPAPVPPPLEVSWSAPVEPDEHPILFDDAAEPIDPGSRRARELRHLSPHGDNVFRRAATGAAAAVVIAALAVGGYELASGHQTPAGTTTTPPTAAATSSGSGSTSASGSGANKGSTSARHHAGSAKPSTGPKSTASGLQPTSQSPSLVTYQAPGSSYSVKFTVTGTSSCWVGVQQRQNGPWLWMGTLTPGSTYTYQASGSVVVRIGAPSEVQVAVSGQKLALPASYVQAYDIALTAGAQASAA